MRIYRRLLAEPDIGLLIAATTLTRVPFAINGLAVLLFMREATGSFGGAGLVTGALALGAGLGAPIAARLVDRRGARALLALAAGHCATLLALLALGEGEAPVALLAGVALGAGVCFPPSGSVLRSQFPALLRDDPELIRGAYAFDSVTIEVSFVSGPLITAVAVAVAGAEAAIILSAVLVVAGTALFCARLPAAMRAPRAPDGPRRGLGALADPGVRAIAAGTVPIGFCLGAVEVALPAFSDAQGSPELAGVLLAVWSLASAIGGFAFGARPLASGLVETYLWIALLFPLACLPLALAGSPAAMFPLVVLAGLPIAPMIASRNELVGAVTSGATATEAFTWLMTALIAGIAAGNAVAGALSDSHGWPEAVLAGATVAFAGALVGFARRGALRPRPATA